MGDRQAAREKNTSSESNMRLAKRLFALSGSDGFERILSGVFQRRKVGKTVLPLHAGELDFNTPDVIVESAIEALRQHQTRYTPAAGIPLLRERIATHVASTRNIPVTADNVVVAPGAKPLIHFALLALCEPGDEVLYFSPAYPIYCSLIRFVGATPIGVPFDIGNGQIDLSLVEQNITPRTRAIIVNSPNNPTGSMLAPGALIGLAEIAKAHDLFVISDEIYSRITYTKAFRSIASLDGMPERTLIIDGFSKTFAMTGWRLGYGVMPVGLAQHFSALMLNTLSCNVAFTQYAAITALDSDTRIVDNMVESLCRRRDMVVSSLNNIPGVSCSVPDGAFYAFADVRSLGMPSLEIALALLDDYGVAVYPGSAFGGEGEGHIRLSFACSSEELRDAIERIAGFVELRLRGGFKEL